MRLGRLMVGLLLVSACSTPVAPTQTSTPSPTEQPVRGSTLVHAITSEPTTLQPLLAPLAAGLALVDLVYANLVMVDSTGLVKPWLAEWSIADGGRTWEWSILPEANWSDGKPITSEDVLTTLRAIGMSNRTTAKRFISVEGFADFGAGRSDTITGFVIDPKDPKRFTVRLTVSTCLNPLAIPPLPTHVFGKYLQPGAGDAFDRAPENDAPPISSGPFVLSEWRRGEHLHFVRNPVYVLGEPHLDAYTLKVLPVERWVQQLHSGAVHYAVIASPLYGSLPSLEADPGLRIVRTEGSGYTLFGWNTESATAPALRDRKVRQALAYGFDTDLARQQIVGLGQPALSHHVPGHWAHPAGLNQYGYDPSRARQLLQEAGYVFGDGGFQERDGQVLSLVLETNGDNTARVRMLQLAVDLYQEIGVRVTPLVHPSFTQLLERGQRLGVTEGVITGFELNPYLEGDPFVAWHSSQIPDPAANPPRIGNNLTHFRNTDVDRAIEAGRTGSDCSLEARRARYQTVNRILNEEQPGFFGLTNVRIRAVSARLRGYEPKVYGDFDVQTAHLWWLAPEAK